MMTPLTRFLSQCFRQRAIVDRNSTKMFMMNPSNQNEISERFAYIVGATQFEVAASHISPKWKVFKIYFLFVCVSVILGISHCLGKLELDLTEARYSSFDLCVRPWIQFSPLSSV